MWFFDDDVGYKEVECIRDVMIIKVGVVVDYLKEMYEICEKVLNDSVGFFKIVFKKDFYVKVFFVLC